MDVSAENHAAIGKHSIRLGGNPGTAGDLASEESQFKAMPCRASAASRSALQAAFAHPQSVVNWNHDGGSSSVGRASDCGSECRGFKSRLPPQLRASKMAMPPCENCGKRSIRMRHRVFLTDTKKPVYYCWSCSAKSLEDGSAYTQHIVSAKRLGLTGDEAKAPVIRKVKP